MPDDQQLSAQDIQDLQEIATHLPTGHPMQGKLSALLNSQPTQFETDRTPDAQTGGFWGGVGSATGANHPAPSTAQAVKEGVLAGMPGIGMAQSLYGAAKNAVPNYKAGGAAGVLGPLVGVDPQSMAARAERGDTAGIMGEAAVPTVLALSPFAAEGVGKGVRGVARAIPDVDLAAKVRDFAGTGADLTEQKVKAWQGKNSEVTADNQQSLAAARSAHETEVSDIERDNAKATTEAQDKWVRRAQVISDANKKGEAQVALRKQLEQEAKQHSTDLVQHLPELAKQAFEEGKAKYDAADVNGLADTEKLHEDLESVVDQKLKGIGGIPPVLAKVMKSVEPPPDLLSQASVFGGAGKAARGAGKGDLAMSGEFRRLNNLDGPERLQYIHPEGEDPPDFNKLHEMMSDLGNAAAKAKMPDERAALWEAHNVIDSHMKKLSDAEGKTALFEDAQKTYNQNFNTFKKTWKDAKGEASPIARALQSKDPVSGEILPTHAIDILMKDKNYTLAKQLLDRYPAARVDLLNQLKDKTGRIKDLPESFEPKPLPTQAVIPQKGMPTSQHISLKEPPEALDIPGDKAEIIRKKAEMLGSFQGRGMFIDTAALLSAPKTGGLSLAVPVARRLLAKRMAANAKRGGSLVQLTPAEENMIKSTQVYSSKKAALAARKP